MEHVILVDENDVAQGTMEKMEAHAKAQLHRAFSVFIFDEAGKMLMQQRSEKNTIAVGYGPTVVAVIHAPAKMWQLPPVADCRKSLDSLLPLKKYLISFISQLLRTGSPNMNLIMYL